MYEMSFCCLSTLLVTKANSNNDRHRNASQSALYIGREASNRACKTGMKTSFEERGYVKVAFLSHPCKSQQLHRLTLSLPLVQRHHTGGRPSLHQQQPTPLQWRCRRHPRPPRPRRGSCAQGEPLICRYIGLHEACDDYERLEVVA
jgi:hypothetical protein